MAEKKKGAIRSFIDGMFDGIGGKIQGLAEGLCWIGVIISVILGIVFFVWLVKPSEPSSENIGKYFSGTTVSYEETVNALNAAIDSFFGTHLSESPATGEIAEGWWNNPPADTDDYHYEIGYGKGSSAAESREWAKTNAAFALEQYQRNCIDAIEITVELYYPNQENVIKGLQVFERRVHTTLTGVSYEFHPMDDGGVYALACLPIGPLVKDLKAQVKDLLDNKTAAEEANRLMQEAIDKYFGPSESTAVRSPSRRSVWSVIGRILEIIWCIVGGVFVMLLGSLLSWIVSWFIHGFGELIENSNTLAEIRKEEQCRLVGKGKQNHRHRISAEKRFIRYRGSNSKRR